MTPEIQKARDVLHTNQFLERIIFDIKHQVFPFVIDGQIHPDLKPWLLELVKFFDDENRKV